MVSMLPIFQPSCPKPRYNESCVKEVAVYNNHASRLEATYLYIQKLCRRQQNVQLLRKDHKREAQSVFPRPTWPQFTRREKNTTLLTCICCKSLEHIGLSVSRIIFHIIRF